MPELIELFDGFVESIKAKDVDKFVNLLAEDATYKGPGVKLLSGKEEIGSFMASEFAKVSDYSVEKLLTCEKGNAIIVEWRVHYRDVTVNKTFDVNGITIIEAKEGLIHKMREYIET